MTGDSRVRLWQTSTNHITFEYAQLNPQYVQAGERITDRNGLVHRIYPVAERYPVGLMLSLPPEELTRLSADPVTQLSAIDWLELMFGSKAELLVYCQGETLSDAGTPLIRNLAYRAVLDEIPGACFGSLPVSGFTPEWLEFKLVVSEDGTFGDLDSLGSYVPRTPARP